MKPNAKLSRFFGRLREQLEGYVAGEVTTLDGLAQDLDLGVRLAQISAGQVPVASLSPAQAEAPPMGEQEIERFLADEDGLQRRIDEVQRIAWYFDMLERGSAPSDAAATGEGYAGEQSGGGTEPGALMP